MINQNIIIIEYSKQLVMIEWYTIGRSSRGSTHPYW